MRMRLRDVCLVMLTSMSVSCDGKSASKQIETRDSPSRQVASGDDCERAGAKLFASKSVAAEVYEYEHQPGRVRPTPGARQAQWIEACRKAQHPIKVPIRDRTTTRAMREGLVEFARQNIDCILPAGTDDEIYNCFVAYMRTPPPSEPTVVLKQIASLATEKYRSTGSFPKGSAPPTPACDSHGKSRWTHPTWQELGLRIDDDELALQYTYKSEGTSFLAEAWRRSEECDPDRRTNVAAFAVSGQIVGGDVKTSLTKSSTR